MAALPAQPHDAKVTRFRLGQVGQVFATRARAEQIRADVESLAAGADEVVIDFDGVRSVSFSFADELFGILGQHHDEGLGRPLPVAIGLTAQVQRVLLGALDQRGIPADRRRLLVPH